MSRRDQEASGSPYDQASPPSYQPAPADSSYTYGYQPESYPNAGTGYGDGHPRAAVFPASASGLPGYGQLPTYQLAADRNDRTLRHESSGRGAESQSRRGHRDTTDRRERNESTSAKHEHSKSKHRKSGRDGNRDSDTPLDFRHGRTGSRPSLTPQGGGAAPGASSRGQRYLSPLPPMPGAPMITRLPTPNFDDEDGYDDDGYCQHNVSAYQFCACCANERQTYPAK
ncbi:hypothetical protein Hte_009288 [Hypoxylon texense]